MPHSLSKENFLIIEITGNIARVTKCETDFENKTAYYSLSYTGPVGELKKMVGKFWRLHKYKILVISDTKTLSTIYASVEIVRENPKELIDEVDLENIVSQAIWKLYDRERREMAAKIGVNEVELLLCDVKVRGLKIDGHRVMNAIGFPARTVEVMLRQTLGSRSFLENIKTALANKAEPASIVEYGAARNCILGRISSKDKFLLVESLGNETALFMYNKGHIRYINNFQWGEHLLFKGLAGELAVTPRMARMLFNSYLEGTASDHFNARFEALVMREFKVCINGIALGLRNHDELKSARQLPIYFSSALTLPKAVFKRRFDFGIKNSTILPVKTEQCASELGFSMEGYKTPETLVPLLEFYLSSITIIIN